MPAGPGRPKGSLNKATAAVRKAAQKYSKDALKTLAEIMEHGDNELARIAAAREILDRAHGKPAQSLEHTGQDGGPVLVTFGGRHRPKEQE